MHRRDDRRGPGRRNLERGRGGGRPLRGDGEAASVVPESRGVSQQGGEAQERSSVTGLGGVVDHVVGQVEDVVDRHPFRESLLDVLEAHGRSGQDGHYTVLGPAWPPGRSPRTARSAKNAAARRTAPRARNESARVIELRLLRS